MNKVLMAMAFSAVFVAIPASAQLYVGAGVGDANTDSYNTSYKLLGGLQAIKNVGVEVAYNDFGGYRGDRADSWSLVGTLPLDKWNIFGKLGVSQNHIKFDGSFHHTDLLAGVGVGYNFTNNVGVRLEYEDFGKLPTDFTGRSTKASNWGLKAKYSFY